MLAHFLLLPQKSCIYYTFHKDAIRYDIFSMVNGMHSLSVLIAENCHTHGWICENDIPWCAYALEQKLLTVVFFLLLVPIVSILGVLPESVIFSCVFYFFRRRSGGWHAPYVWLCQGCSIALVLISTMIIGPMLTGIPIKFLWEMNLAVMFIAFVRKPVYQHQIHFNHEVTIANNKKKQRFLLHIFILQVVLGFFLKAIIIYSLLGVLTGVASVYIELIQQHMTRKKAYYEKNRTSR